MINFHHESDAAATMAVRSYEVQVPCGAVDIDDHEIKGLLEKHVTRHFINAGIYVLGPVALELIPHDGAFDMPDLFEACQASGLSTPAYPVQEYWVDIGQTDDYRRANEEFSQIF